MSTINFDASAVLTGRPLEAVYAFAWTLLDGHRLLDATKAFRVLVRYAPSDERSWLGLGACHEELGQDDIARELYGAGSLVSSPRSVRCLLAAARLQRRCGERATSDDLIAEAWSLADDLEDDDLRALVERERGVT